MKFFIILSIFLPLIAATCHKRFQVDNLMACLLKRTSGYEEAKLSCEDEGGKLFKITTQPQLNALKTALAGGSSDITQMWVRGERTDGGVWMVGEREIFEGAPWVVGPQDGGNRLTLEYFDGLYKFQGENADKQGNFTLCVESNESTIV